MRPDPWRPAAERSYLLRAVLWAADRLRRPIAAAGVDFPVFRECLRVKLLLELRSASRSGPSTGAAGLALGVVMFWFVGLLTGLVALLSRDAWNWIAVSQSVSMGFLGMLLLAQFASLLVDPSDIGVVSPHPVPDRTLFAARLAHVAAYVTLLATPFALGSMLLAVFGKPVLQVLLVFPLISLCSTLLTVGIVALLFALSLRIFGPARFQRVTLWIQIAGAA